MSGQVMVKLAPNQIALPSQREGALTDDPVLNGAMAAAGIQELIPFFPAAKKPFLGEQITTPDGTAMPKPDLTLWYKANLNQGIDVMAAVNILQKITGIAAVEPNYLRKPVGDPSSVISQPEAAGLNTALSLPGPATDPLYNQQWHLAAAHVPEAWTYLNSLGLAPGGSRDIVVAVIDTGVDYNHPDLAANIWINQGELNGLPGVDDDADGYVDDLYGANVVAHNGDPMDDQGHGTHVAGIIAAQANNNQGGVGVAYNVQVMPVKAAQYSGVLTASDIAAGIYYAVSKGADVINMSFGGYSRSQVEEDALAVAYGQAVLVAAAGNDGLPDLPCFGGKDMYPAAYDWVLGVMASDPRDNRAGFSNWDCSPHDTHEYEIMAPGVDILSTLPGSQYAAWDGTSMSAPVVSGIAALARTRWSDKNLYSSRFIMGQIAASAPLVDALSAVTTAPKPSLDYMQHWVFDTTVQDPTNDNDGIVDAGETVDLAIQIRNHWGKADPVTVKLEPLAEGAFLPDPYVTMITDTVDYGAIGSFNADDNGLIYDAHGVVSGVQNPFRFQAATDTPNDHVIPFRLTMTAGNGLNPADPGAPYTSTSYFYLVVQRGRELPRVISQDLTISKDYLWIVPDATLIENGVTVMVEAGAQVQWGTPTPSNPYGGVPNPYIQVEGSLLVQGTADEPVEFFPSTQLPGQKVSLTANYNSGFTDLRYVRIREAMINLHGGCGVQSDPLNNHFDHAYFDGNGACVTGVSINNSVFNTWANIQMASLSNSLIDGANLDDFQYQNYQITNTTFINNIGRPTPSSLRVRSGYPEYPFSFPVTRDETTYVVFDGSQFFRWGDPPKHMAEQVAQYLGGHEVTIDDQAENDFITEYINTNLPGGNVQIGLTDSTEGVFSWMSGALVGYTAWMAGGYPTSLTGTDIVTVYGDGFWRNWSGNDSYGLTLLELPGIWSQAQLDLKKSEIKDYLAGQNSVITQNAFLSPYWDPNPAHWFQLQGDYLDRQYSVGAANNYWGTTSNTLIDAAILDYNDNFNYSKVIYQPYLTTPAESTYPFVSNISLTTSEGPDILTVGAEPVTFTVTYNRDMDPAVQPQVTFGPGVPYTDFTVKPADGGWQDARTWKGVFNVTPTTGDGYQLIRIAGGRAASDPWLVAGNDSGRFRFEVVTSGTEAMNLQAAGGEGYVDLSWSQSDFDLLSGFNLYRATSQAGAYSRINPFIISPQTRSFRDTNVTSGQPYYYKFTVVKSDMSESSPSNIGQATPLDTIPPVLTHTPVTSADPGLPLSLTASATDNVAVTGVSLFYRSAGVGSYNSKAMVKTTGNNYSATLEGSLMTSPGIQYYIEATDGINVTRSGRADTPHLISINDRPVITIVTPNTGPAGGGTAVTLSGSNFKPGATVAFGGAAASNVTVVSPNQITCITPAHFPASVDVQVANPAAQTGTLLNGFTYRSTTTSLSLPNTGGANGKIVTVPVNASNLTGLVAASLTVHFDNTVLHAKSVETGNLTPGWSLAANLNIPGQVRISLASPGGSVQGAGVVANIEFEVVGSAASSSPLTLTDISLNDGAIPAEGNAGSFLVDLVYDISGMVRFWNGGAGVPGVSMTLHGIQDYLAISDQAGAYIIRGAASGNYSLAPAKPDDDNGITAYDAALVLQDNVGLITLMGYAATAADVNQSGTITGMDASYILQKSVGLISTPFPGAGKVWVFNPMQHSYTNLTADQTAQDFTGVLLGDVSGSWLANGQMHPEDINRAGVRDSLAVIKLEAGVPDASGDVTATILLDPDAAPVFSIDLVLSYDPLKAAAVDAALDPGVSDWLFAANLTSPGAIRIALANADPITQPTCIGKIRFHLGNAHHSVRLQPTAGLVNEGSIPLQLLGTDLGLPTVYLPLLLRH